MTHSWRSEQVNTEYKWVRVWLHHPSKQTDVQTKRKTQRIEGTMGRLTGWCGQAVRSETGLQRAQFKSSKEWRKHGGKGTRRRWNKLKRKETKPEKEPWQKGGKTTFNLEFDLFALHQERGRSKVRCRRLHLLVTSFGRMTERPWGELVCIGHTASQKMWWQSKRTVKVPWITTTQQTNLDSQNTWETARYIVMRPWGSK